MNFIQWQLVVFGATFLYASYFEWCLHRFFMHRPTFFRYPFRAHALVHHQVFKADTSYHLQKPEDKWLITFAWWNYPLLLAIHAPVLIGMEYLGFHVIVGAVPAMSLYYFLYEYLHFCMHKPSGRFFERMSFFKFVNKNHFRHHQFMSKNLNVVFPLADLTLRTFLFNSQLPKKIPHSHEI